MWDILLGVILGSICAATGFLGAALIGYHILLLFGVSNVQKKAAMWSAIGFGIPAAVVAFVIGYRMGSTLVYT
jgi:hypothetical protein